MRIGGPYKVDVSFVGYSANTYTDIFLKLGENYVQNGQLRESTTILAGSCCHRRNSETQF